MPDFKLLESERENIFELLINLFITESEDVIGPKLTTVNNENIQVVVLQRNGGIKIGLRAEDFAELRIHFNFKIHNLCGDVYKSIQLEATLSMLQSEAFSDEIRKPRELSYTENVYFFDSYIIHCCIRVNPSSSSSRNFIRDSIMPSENLSQLQRDLRTLINDKRSSDVALAVGKEIVHAHKNVLSSRSAVFRKMFEQQGTAQNSLTLVDIVEVDLEKSVLEAILLFLYTGIVDCVDFNTAMALYSAADKYDIKTLKTTCSNILASKMTTKTVLSVLRLADFHNDVRLKNIAADFIRLNLEEVEATEEWKHLVKSNVYLFSFISKEKSSKLATKRKRED